MTNSKKVSDGLKSNEVIFIVWCACFKTVIMTKGTWSKA